MGFYQAIVVNQDEPELWFVGVMAFLLLAIVGTITFLIVKGRKTPTGKIDPSPEKAIGIQDEIDEE